MSFWRQQKAAAGGGATVSEPAEPTYQDVLRQRDLDRLERLERYDLRTPELQAELEAMQQPADLYRIEKDHAAGTFTVRRWSKWIADGLGWGPGTDGYDFRSVFAGHEVIKAGLPTHKAAEGWLKAYLDPTTNQTGYDAEGNRIGVKS